MGAIAWAVDNNSLAHAVMALQVNDQQSLRGSREAPLLSRQFSGTART